MATSKKLKVDKKTVTKLTENELYQIAGGNAITVTGFCSPTFIDCITKTCPQQCGSVVEY
jgi:hypothetical protein